MRTANFLNQHPELPLVHCTANRAASRCVRIGAWSVWMIMLITIATNASAQETPDERVAVIDNVWDIVEKDFYDPQLRGLDSSKIRTEFRERARDIAWKEFPNLVNEMLGRLQTSHTAFFSPNNPRYHQLLGIFEFLVPDNDDPRLFYEGIGIETVRHDGKHFVKCVYDGFPAHQAGLKYGDEIVSVDGLPWDGLRSFRGKQDQEVSLKIRRQTSGDPMSLTVKVQKLNGRTMFKDALRASLRKFENDNRSVGYMHLWSYAGADYHDFVRQQLLWDQLKDCDAVILDLRDGWGGASLEYLNLFREPLVKTSSLSRNGDRQSYDGAWSRPVVLLVNGGSTSGKEMFSFAFKKHGFGKIVGSRTAGAVVAGSPRLLDSGDVLYLAVSDVRVDGQRIEGVGVEPDVSVQRPLPYAAGADPQLDAAVDAAVKMMKRRKQSGESPNR